MASGTSDVCLVVDVVLDVMPKCTSSAPHQPSRDPTASQTKTSCPAQGHSCHKSIPPPPPPHRYTLDTSPIATSDPRQVLKSIRAALAAESSPPCVDWTHSSSWWTHSTAWGGLNADGGGVRSGDFENIVLKSSLTVGRTPGRRVGDFGRFGLFIFSNGDELPGCFVLDSVAGGGVLEVPKFVGLVSVKKVELGVAS